MNDDPNKLSGHAAWKPGIAIEGDAIPDLRQDRQISHRHGEAGISGATQQTIELLDLPPLAFPSHPQSFPLVPLAKAVKQEEAVGGAVRVPCVQRGNARARGLEDLRVLWQRLCRRVGKITQE